MEPARLDEVDLLAAAAAGEPTAVAWLLDDIGPIVYGFVFARVGGELHVAEDLLQETLLEAVKSASGFRGESAVSTWMCTIARRRVARHWERERRQATARRHLTVVGGIERVVAAPDDAHADRDVVIQALGSLSPIHRQVLVLKYLEDRTVEEIADELSKSRVQVQSLLQRGRLALRAALGGES
jgi:RNA polymerase sigma-70 factor (ECF subfamily)